METFKSKDEISLMYIYTGAVAHVESIRQARMKIWACNNNISSVHIK